MSERYYNEKGEAYLDIDYTDHLNSKAYPHVPHIHRWERDKDGNLSRKKGEDFK